MVSLWMLDETSGTTADNEEGTAGRDGTYTGGVTLNQSGFDTGIASVALNGSTGYITVPYSAAMATTAFTFEAWVYRTSATLAHIAHNYAGTAKGWSLFIDAAGLVEFDCFCSTGTRYAVTNSGVISTGAWYHIVGVMESATSTPLLYVNGANATATSAATHPANPFVVQSAGAMEFGRYYTASQYHNGRLAALAYYSEAKSAAQVAEMYEARLNTSAASAYSNLSASSARWANLGTGSSTYTLNSTGLAKGSELSVEYRDARL
jgi:hypothetical protein